MVLMRLQSKTLIELLLVLLAVASVSFVKPANSQTIPATSVPQFTIRTVNAPDTNFLIEISIKSQPFAYSNNGTLYQGYYNIRAKQHSAENWTELYVYNGTRSFNGGGPTPIKNFSYALYISPEAPIQSDSAATVNLYVIPVEFHLENNSVLEGYSIQYTYGIWGANPIGNYTFLDEVPVGGQLDFQVQEIVGHNSTAWYNISALWAGVGTYVPAVAYDSEGNWSNTQTITIGKSPAPSPTVPELSWLVIIPLLLSMFTIAFVVKNRKSR
jgi:hypothetical protein